MARETFARLSLRSEFIAGAQDFVSLIESFMVAHQALTNFSTALGSVGRPLVLRGVVRPVSLLEAYDYFEARSSHRRAQLETFLQGEGRPDDRLTSWPMVHRGELLISHIHMNSPLDLSVIGNLNPLEALRNYLKDRHERHLDRTYRSQADAEERALRSELLRTQLEAAHLQNWEQALRIARENGATTAQINKLLEKRIGPVIAKVGQVTDMLNVQIPRNALKNLVEVDPALNARLRSQSDDDTRDA